VVVGTIENIIIIVYSFFINDIKFEPKETGLIDVLYSYKKNNTTFLIFGSFADFIDGCLCFLNNFEKIFGYSIEPFNCFSKFV